MAISAHLINILLISVRFSGVLSATAVDAVESGVPRPLCYKNKHSVFQCFQFLCISYGQFRKNATFSNYRAQLHSEKLSVTRDPKLRYFRCARLCWSKNLRYQLIQSKATKTNQVLGTGVPCSSKRMLVLSLSSQWLLKYFLSH